MVRFLMIFCFCLPFMALSQRKDPRVLYEKDVTNGAARFSEYLPLLAGKRVAIVANTTSKIGKTHLVDTLLKLKVNIKKIFGPEHGFRGEADAGEKVGTEKDKKTGITVVSLFGKHFKPTKEDLKDIDVVIYDIQDVGVRFYTYISTMTYVMEACAENNKKFIVLDRPDPNGHYVDGPVLDPKFKSFLGMHPVPLVYGMTVGEYAQMVNGEGWLTNKVKCDLKVIPVLNYNHVDFYQLPEKPSPNLPNMYAVYYYPSLGLFEGTIVSVGRGTNFPFQVIGHPKLQKKDFSFTPKPNEGSKLPKYMNEVCYGFDLKRFGEDYSRSLKQVNLLWLVGMYTSLKSEPAFFDENFNFHAGNDILQKQIKDGKTEDQITASWIPGIAGFKKIRTKYLLYEDFE
ncbi:MAG: DUF1343 domain-containing protein [Bacteroidia bacterium]|nr:DUF1343 domain-containing protein [Bacteroidia bacterium]